MSRRVVIIGAGVVGAALADALVARGERDVLVLDKGPLFSTGGSSSHAPGLVSRTSTSRFMTETADATIRAFAALSTDDGPALLPVGTLEVAYNEARLAELWRRWGAAQAFGWHGRMIDPDEVLARWPIIERDGLLGGYATEGEGLAVALRGVEAQAARAAEARASWGTPRSPASSTATAASPGCAPAARSSPPTWWSVAPAYGAPRVASWDSRCRCWRWSISTSSLAGAGARRERGERGRRARSCATTTPGCTTATTATESGSVFNHRRPAGGGHRTRHPRTPRRHRLRLHRRRTSPIPGS